VSIKGSWSRVKKTDQYNDNLDRIYKRGFWRPDCHNCGAPIKFLVDLKVCDCCGQMFDRKHGVWLQSDMPTDSPRDTCKKCSRRGKACWRYRRTLMLSADEFIGIKDPKFKEKFPGTPRTSPNKFYE